MGRVLAMAAVLAFGAGCVGSAGPDAVGGTGEAPPGPVVPREPETFVTTGTVEASASAAGTGFLYTYARLFDAPPEEMVAVQTEVVFTLTGGTTARDGMRLAFTKGPEDDAMAVADEPDGRGVFVLRLGNATWNGGRLYLEIGPDTGEAVAASGPDAWTAYTTVFYSAPPDSYTAVPKGGA